jgi:uncharacterized protein (DUF1330 family)
MNMNYKVAIALVAGTAFGAAVIQVLHAQTKPLAYVIAEVEVTDAPTYKTFLDGTAPILNKYGAKFLVRGGKTLSIAGEPPKRIAVYTFENMDRAAAFINDPELKALEPIRDKSSKYRAYMAEGTN